MKVEFTQPPVRPDPARGLAWLSDCARYAIVLGDRLLGTPLSELGLTPVYRAVWLSPAGQRLVRRARGRNGRKSFAAAVRDARRHERAQRSASGRKQRRRRRSRHFEIKRQRLPTR